MKEKKPKEPKIKGKGTIKKFILGTIFSVVGAIGVICLVIYLTGGFSNPPVNPENIFFANAVVQEDGSTEYVSRGSESYYVDSNVELIVSTSTKGVNQKEIELGFPKGETKVFVKIVDESVELSSRVKVFYGLDNNGSRLKFASCDESEASYITNGIIIVPKYIQLDSYFTAILVVAPDDASEVVTPEVKLYNVGGYTQLTAKSRKNLTISSTSTSFNIDVPVEKIEVVGKTANNLGGDGNELSLRENDEKIEVGTENLFSAVLNVTPSRAIYKYGKDGKNGEKEYKKAVFAFDKDVNNGGKLIAFVGSDGEEISGSTMEGGKIYVYGEDEKIGTSFLTTSLTGEFKVYARMYKTAKQENEFSSLTEISEIYGKMGEKTFGISCSKQFLIKQIAISGFETKNSFNEENPLSLAINKWSKIIANDTTVVNSLGIEINASQGSAQNNIKNILISIQAKLASGEWIDATKQNGETPAFFAFFEGSNSKKITQESLLIDETNELYEFNFYRPFVKSASNLSYWEVCSLPSCENFSSYGVEEVRIGIYYLNPETGLSLENEKYGPYYVPTMVESVVDPVLAWGDERELKINSELPVGEVNERAFVSSSQEFDQYNTISIEKFAKIKNLSENPTYTTVKYFVSSKLDNLNNYLNVSKYSGEIPGISDYIYLVDSLDKLKVIGLGDRDSIEFNLFFAVVESTVDGGIGIYDGAYRIVALPKNAGKISYAPIKIERTIGTISLWLDEGTKVQPYATAEGESDPRANGLYFLQKISKNVEILIKIDKKDENLFLALAKDGKINLGANPDLFLEIGTNEVQLENALSTIFALENPFSVLKRTESDLEIKYTLTLSTRQVDFADDEAEKLEEVTLTYERNGKNLPESLKSVSSTSPSFYIYSGKVRKAWFGTKENPQTNATIDVVKTFNKDALEKFTTTYESVAISDGKLVVYVEGFGFDDSYSVVSSDPSVVSVSYSEGSYKLSFVKEGKATLTLKLNHAHRDFEEQQINFSVSSNYEIIAEMVENSSDLEGIDERILEYDKNLGTYTILGTKDTNPVDIRQLIKIYAVYEGVSDETETAMEVKEEITDEFAFNHDGECGKLSWGDFSDKLTIDDNFGGAGAFVVTVSNSTIGFAKVFGITIKPYYTLTYTAPSHEGAPKGEGGIGIFAEAKLTISDFALYYYSKEKKTYSENIETPDFYLSLWKNGEQVGETQKAVSGETLSFYADSVVVAKVELTASELAITFDNVYGKYTLKISNKNPSDVFDVNSELIFNVSTNIKVDKTNADNKNNPVLNGDEIQVGMENPTVQIGDVVFSFSRLFESETISISNKNIISIKIGGKELETSVETSGNLKILGATELSEAIVTFVYGEETFELSFYVAPNITKSNFAKTVKYDGKEYVSLYANQDVSKLEMWFSCEDGRSVSTSLGKLQTKDNKILSLPRLYELCKNNSELTQDGYTIRFEKTQDGFILTEIVVVAKGESEVEHSVFDAIISPFDWEAFIDYAKDSSNNYHDIKKVLGGEHSTELLSGKDLKLGDHIFPIGRKKQLDALLNNTTSRISSYRLFRKNGEIWEEVSGETKIRFTTTEGLKVVTEPVAKDCFYRVEFVYIGKADDSTIPEAEFVFSYYINVKGTQKIDVSYPYSSGVCKNQTTGGTVEEIFAEKESKHIVYFDQFIEGTYSIELSTKLRNFNKQEYAKIGFNPKLSESSVMNTSQPFMNTSQPYNVLNFEIWKVFVAGEEVGIKTDYATVSAKGEVSLLKKESFGVIVRISTINGAENFYKILVKSRPESQTVSDKSVNIANIGSEVEISNGFNLSQITVSGVTKPVQYAIIDEKGNVQTNGAIAIDSASAPNKITVKQSPNEQRAILVVFSEAEGTLAEITLVAKSVINVEFKQDGLIYGDSKQDLKALTTIKVNGSDIGKTCYCVDDESETCACVDGGTETCKCLFWKIEITQGAEYVSENKGSSLTFVPVSMERSVSGKLYVWGGAIEGTSEENPCVSLFTLNIASGITAKDNGNASTKQSETPYSLNLTKIFEFEPSGFTPTNYKYSASYVWDGQTGEDLVITNGTGDFTSSSKLSIKIPHVSATRTATIKVVVWKESGETKEGESVSGTFTLTINPVYTATIKYPSYGTGKEFLSEAFYAVNGKSLDLSKDERITILPTGSGTTDWSKFTLESSDENLIKVDPENSTTIKVQKAIDKIRYVDIRVKIERTEVVIATYKLVLSPTPVLTAEFEDGTSTRTETIPENELSNKEITKLFEVKDGFVKASSKAGTKDVGTISFVAKASGEFDVTIYAIGGDIAQNAKLYVLKNANKGSDSTDSTPVVSGSETVSGVTSFDILGESADSAICDLQSGSLSFKQAGIWPIEITTESGPTCYYVVVNFSEDAFSATYYKELGKNKLTFAEIFGEVKEAEYQIVSGENTACLIIEKELPRALLDFHYIHEGVKHKIPYESASTSFKYSPDSSETSNTIGSYEIGQISYNTEKTLTIKDQFGNEVATYSYTIVRNFKFDSDAFENVEVGNDGTATYVENPINSYNEGEFGGYKTEEKTTLRVLRTIELNARQTYNLKTLLTRELGLSAFRGGEFSETISLSDGSYISNENFKNNVSGLISWTVSEGNYNITPHGAQNGGDVVHFVLTIGDGENPDKFILRIKIKPIAQIEILRESGEFQIACDELEGNPTDTKIEVNDLVKLTNVDISNVKILVVPNSSSAYVQGSDQNKLTQWFNDSTTKTDLRYGVVFDKTELGGAEIKLVITDFYGYQATIGDDKAEIIIKYVKSDGTSVQLDQSASTQQIFEGDSFEIWGTSSEISGENKYFKYNYNNKNWEQGQSSAPTAEAKNNVQYLILENLPVKDNQLQSLTITISESANLKAKLESELGKVTTCLKDNKINFMKNTVFGAEEQIKGKNFVITINYLDDERTEEMSFEISTAIKQRYKVVAKAPFDKEQTIYIPIQYSTQDWKKLSWNGNKFESAGEISIENMFEVFDIKQGTVSKNADEETASASASSYQAIGGGNFETIGTPTFNSSKLVENGSGTWSGTYTLNVNSETPSIEGNTFSFNYQYVAEFVGIDIDEANTYTSYGLVIPGATEKVLISNLSRVRFVDYYGNKTNVLASHASYISGIDEDGTKINPGKGIEVTFYGDGNKTDNTRIDSLTVTRAKYYTIGLKGENDSENCSLEFSNSGTGWGEVIKAVASGEPDIKEDLTPAGLFSYGILSSNNNKATIQGTDNPTIVSNGATEIVLGIFFMRNGLGVAQLTTSDNGTTWIVKILDAKILTHFEGGYVLTESGELVLESVPHARSKGSKWIEKLYIPSQINGRTLLLGGNITNIDTYKIISFPNGNPSPEKGEKYYTIGGRNFEKDGESNEFYRVTTISFNANGGGGNQSLEPKYFEHKNGTPLSDVITGGTRTGYLFDGWFAKCGESCEHEIKVADKNGNLVLGECEDCGIVYTQTTGADVIWVFRPDVTLYAKWTPITYNVSYNKNGADGGETMENSSFTYDEKQNLSTNLYTRTGYVFVGWAESANGEALYSDEELVKNLWSKNNGTRTLFAVWCGVPYTVSYDKNGADGEETMENSTHSYGTKSSLSKNAYTKTGYTFAGWARSADGSVEFKDEEGVTDLSTKGETILLYAKWAPIAYTVSYNKNGADGEETMGNSSFTYDKEQNLSKNAYTKTGYAFAGWAKSTEGEVAYGDGATILNLTAEENGNVELYAKWTANSYTIVFNSNKPGNATNEVENTMEKQERKFDDGAELSENAFALKFWEFVGWNTSSDGKGNSIGNKTTNNITSKTGEITLYAQWEAQSYKIEFNANKPENSKSVVNMASETKEFNFDTKASYNGITRTGYDFTTWNTSSDGTGTSYNYDALKNVASSSGETVTLYAQWKVINYTITLDKDAELTMVGIVTYEAKVGNSNTGGDSKLLNHEYSFDYTIEDEVWVGSPTNSYENGKMFLFEGWGSERAKEITIKAGSTGNKSYTAYFKRQAKVTFKLYNYDKEEWEVYQISYLTIGEKYGTLPSVDFLVGWYSKYDGSYKNKIDQNTIVGGDSYYITLYGKREVTITINKINYGSYVTVKCDNSAVTSTYNAEYGTDVEVDISLKAIAELNNLKLSWEVAGTCSVENNTSGGDGWSVDTANKSGSLRTYSNLQINSVYIVLKAVKGNITINLTTSKV